MPGRPNLDLSLHHRRARARDPLPWTASWAGYSNPAACRECGLKPQCTPNKRGRRITRWVDEHLLEAMPARVQAEPEKVGLRKQLAEHPFGTIKHSWNQGYFLMRGLEEVRAEMALTVMAYDLKRVIRILGVRRMIEALG